MPENQADVQKMINQSGKKLTPAKEPVKADNFSGWAEKIIKSYQLIAFGLALILLFVTGLLLIFAYTSNIVELQAETDKQNGILEAKKQELKNLGEVKLNYQTLEASAQKILEALPVEKELPGMIIELEKLAEKNNLLMNTLNISEDPTNITTAGQLKKMTLVLNITGGDYLTVKNYIFDIEREIRIMDITALTFSPEAKSFNVTVSTYYWADK